MLQHYLQNYASVNLNAAFTEKAAFTIMKGNAFMSRYTIWRSGNTVMQCRNPHVEQCAEYDVDNLKDAYRDAVNEYSDRWFKYADATPPYIEHKEFHERFYFFPTEEAAIAATRKNIEDYCSK